MGWRSVPVAPLALAFGVGVGLAPVVSERISWYAWGVGIVAAVILVVQGREALAPLLLAVGALGALRATPQPLSPDHIARLTLPATAQIQGRLATEPVRWAADRTRLLIDTERADGVSRTGRIQATVYGELPVLTQGQRVALELRLREALGFRNPGVFDYAAHLAREGIHVLATGRAEEVVALDEPAAAWPLRVRRRALTVMREALPPASAALLAGLLLGDRTALPRDLDDAFRRAGVYHVLAVSGFNVALLASSVFTLLVVGRAGRRVAAAGAMMIIIAFASVAGPEPSVVRATLMGVLVLGGIVLERDAAVLNSLSLAALVVLAARPGDLLDPGFQLSFAATGGIVLAPLPRGMLLGSLGVSAAAQLAVLPVMLAHFNQVSTVGVIANLAVVPLAGVATILGLAGVTLAAAVAPVGGLLLDAVWPVLLALRAVVLVTAQVPAAVVHLPAPHWTAVVAYVGALLVALTAWRGRTAASRGARPLALAAGILLGAALLIEAWPLIRPADGRLRVTVLDVGQGDALVVETPDGRAIVVDAGPGGPHRLDTGERVVAPFLWNRGHLSLSGVVLTHDDLDHAGGMAAIQRLFSVTPPDTVAAIVARARRAGVEVSVLTGPPVDARAEVKPVGNDQARALSLALGNVSFLLASDITASTEGDLLRRRTPLAATVLKVAHHGARGSSTADFLRAVRPAVAVVSVGARNSYGHPAPDTMARLLATGAAVYRTDRDGAVILETDGHWLSVTTWASRRRDRFCLGPEAAC